MARLGRNIGITVPQSRGQRVGSIGPALLNVGQNLQQQAFEAGAQKRTAEAQLAAATLNFERDGEGNLLAPALPMGDNGLIAPTIYDQAYAESVFVRYAQQSQIDATAMLSALASLHPFDPEGYKAVAGAYITKISELAPDQIKDKISINAQVKMVEHHNFIARKVAERDYNAGVLTYSRSLDDSREDVLAGMMAGEDVAATEVKYAAHREAILAGMEQHGYFTEPEVQAAYDAFDLAISATATMRGVTELADTEEDLAVGLARLKSLAIGEGDVLAMVNGKMKAVPIAEAFPNIEDQMAISKAAQTIMANKAAAFTGARNAAHVELENDYITYRVGHHLAVADGLVTYDRATANHWIAKAFEEEHYDLANSILVDIMMHQGDTTQTATQQEIAQLVEDVARRRKHATERSDALLGPEGVANLSEEQLAERNQIINDTHILHLEQSEAYQAAYADPAYETFVEEFEGFDPFTSDLDVKFVDSTTKAYINGMIRQTGDLIPTRMAQSIVNNLRDENTNEQVYTRTLEVVYELWKDNGTKRNLKKVLPDGLFNALDNMFMHTAPTNISMTSVRERIQKYDDETYRPHTPWDELGAPARALVVEEAEAAIRKAVQTRRYLVWNELTGTQVEDTFFNWRATWGDSLPHEVVSKIYRGVEAKAGWFNSSDESVRDLAISSVVDEVLFDWGYAPSLWGYDESQALTPMGFFRGNRAKWALALKPPEYIYRTSGRVTEGTKGRPTNSFVMKEIGVDFETMLSLIQSDTAADLNRPINEVMRHTKGENAYLVYDQQWFDDTGKDRYEIMLFQSNDPKNAEIASRTELGIRGRHYYIDFAESGAVERGMNAYWEDFAIQQRKNRETRTRGRLGGFAGSRI